MIYSIAEKYCLQDLYEDGSSIFVWGIVNAWKWHGNIEENKWIY